MSDLCDNFKRVEGNMAGPTAVPFQEFADEICKAIRTEAAATEEFVRDVQIFLNALPRDLKKGDLNVMKMRLWHKCATFFAS